MSVQESTPVDAGPKGIHRRIVFEVTPSLKNRFLAKVQTGNPDECWPWVGAMRNGYGAIKHGKQVLGAHVVALAIAGKTAQPGQVAMHSCDNRICCNPAHLSFGSYSDNVKEMFDRRGVNTTKGEKSYNAVLNDQIVKYIRAKKIVSGTGYRLLSRFLNVSESTVKHVLSFDNWKHVTVAAEEADAIVRDFESRVALGS